jgi:hypothetical protein
LANELLIYFFCVLRESVKRFGWDGLGLGWNERIQTFLENKSERIEQNTALNYGEC